MLVVARRKVLGPRHLLARVAGHVQVPLAEVAGGHGESEHPRFPFHVENWLALLNLHRAEPVHPAHIVDAVHRRSAAGGVTFATPIIASRVTIPDSLSSLHPSVPSGRSGRIRYRTSAVESQ